MMAKRKTRAARPGRPRTDPARGPDGRVVRETPEETRRRKEDAVVLEIRASLVPRCMAMGIEPTPANLRLVTAPIYGCEAGRAIVRHVADPAERQDLFSAAIHLRRVHYAYSVASGAPYRHARGPAMMIPTDPASTSANDLPATDLRGSEERAAAAIAAMERVNGWLSTFRADDVADARNVVLDDARARSPKALTAVLRRVADGLAGGI
jgi:hypothetical protein